MIGLMEGQNKVICKKQPETGGDYLYLLKFIVKCWEFSFIT